MDILLIQILHGLVYGMLLFLLASGLTLIFGLMDVLNFAHGAFYMLGAYFSFSVVLWTGQFWLSLIIAPLLVGSIGMFTERVFLRKVHAYGHISELLLTFGIAYILEDVVKIIWGTEPLKVKIPAILSGSLSILGGAYPIYRLFILVVSLLVFAFLFLILFKTRVGIIVRAAVAKKEMVGALGFNVPLIFLLLFGVGSWLAGIAGVIGGPYLTTHPGMGAAILIDLFIVIVVGGLGSIQGALLAGILIGEIRSFGILFLPQFVLFFEFSLLAAVLIFKPEGLLGESK
ncbi:MAG: branched-chain amino acid ABC transporter permease [Thermodesulfobacteriota bacterium]